MFTMGGLVGLTPKDVETAVTATEAMKTGPVQRENIKARSGLRRAQAEFTRRREPDLTFEQKMRLKRAEPAMTPVEKRYIEAGTRLRNAQHKAALHDASGMGDYDLGQRYDDANAYYDDEYRKIQDHFGLWKNEMWSVDKSRVGTGRWEGMTYDDAVKQLTERIEEDNRRIGRGLAPNYATGSKGDVRGRGEADRAIGGMIGRWKQGR